MSHSIIQLYRCITGPVRRAGKYIAKDVSWSNNLLLIPGAYDNGNNQYILCCATVYNCTIYSYGHSTGKLHLTVTIRILLSIKKNRKSCCFRRYRCRYSLSHWKRYYFIVSYLTKYVGIQFSTSAWAVPSSRLKHISMPQQPFLSTPRPPEVM